ncbi:MAG: TetR/AcrR family transcriptional regulator [Planctomycetes bacterium]|nr:TetR/AcrR family transcriptional regulator [Planctomycetota bacterium]
MATLTRKQREIRDRSDLILRVSRELLLERGYLGLTMDRIAVASEYSKGTIYQHFRNKEEIVAALAVQTAEKRVELFRRGGTFLGSTRERMLGMGVAAEVFLRLYPDHFKAEQITRAASIREKISAERAQHLLQLEHGCVDVATAIVQDAVQAGELSLPEGVPPETVSFGLWCLTYGVFTLLVTEGRPLAELGFPEPLRLLEHNQNLLLDGHGWTPLSADHDYAAVRTRLLAEVFPEELAQLEGRA